MRALRILSTSCLLALATVSAVLAVPRVTAPPQSLFERDSTARPAESRVLVPDAAEEFQIALDPAIVAANPETLTIDLPGFPPLEAVRTRFVNDRPNAKSWSGTLRYPGAGGRGTGYIHLGYHGDHLTALIDFEGQRFRIVRGGGKSQRLVRLSEDLSSLSCGMEDPAASSEGSLDLLFSSSEDRADAPPSLVTAALGTAHIDVLAVYPKEFFTVANATAEGSLETFVWDSIMQANDAFANTGIDASYNLVGVVPLTGTSQPVSGLYASLAWMDPRTSTAPTTAPPQELADLRNAFGADLVALYIPFGWNATDACGVANLPLAPTSGGVQRFYRGNLIIQNTTMGDRAFSVNRLNCGQQDFTLGHEMAHNYGMHHHDITYTDSKWLYPHGRGKVLNLPSGTKATVMACHCTGCHCLAPSDPGFCPVGSGAVCNRVPYFSDPTQNYPGTTESLGDSSTTDPRDNARVGRDNVVAYAAVQSPSANTPPTASFTVSCAGRTCTFNASGSTDNTTIPSGGYWWDFGDNQTGTGKITSRTYTAAGAKRVHLVVKDAGGQTDVVWGTANPTVSYEGYHDASNCTSINGWAWDGTPNGATTGGAISVDIYRDGSLVTSVPANVYRADLVTAGKGDGYHAFGYTPNSGWKDGVWHTSVVRFTGTSTNLSTTTRSLICDASIFTNTAAPSENLSTGGQVYTVATRFSSTHSGSITKLGFYRATGETGSNTLRLWTDGGVELANVTTNCSGSGWCWGSISAVTISANTSYRVSVNTNTFQSKTSCGLSSPITNGPLTAHQGYWVLGTSLPTSSGACNSNFYVDVKFNSPANP